MKSLAIVMIMAAFMAFWGFLDLRADREVQEKGQIEAVAMNYCVFRNAVFGYVFKKAGAGEALPDEITPDTPDLGLPQGWAGLRDWQVLTQIHDDGLFYCYVFGPASPDEIMAAQNLLGQSMAVGWNNAGVLVRNGDPWPLPAAIPNGNIVSVIRLD
jgi:hypothetical protein